MGVSTTPKSESQPAVSVQQVGELFVGHASSARWWWLLLRPVYYIIIFFSVLFTLYDSYLDIIHILYNSTIQSIPSNAF